MGQSSSVKETATTSLKKGKERCHTRLFLIFLDGQREVTVFVLDNLVGAGGNNAVFPVAGNCHDQLGIEDFVFVVLVVVVGDDIFLGVLKRHQRIEQLVLALEPDDEFVSFHEL